MTSKAHSDEQKPRNTIFWGIVWTLVGCYCWYLLVGNPLHDLVLILNGRAIPGFIVDTWEDVDETDYGRTIWYHGAVYTYLLPDGREFTKKTPERKGRLKPEFLDLHEPYPVEVEYLQHNPTVSRIKGEGSTTLFDWLWRKAGLGFLLLALFVSPGIFVLKNGIVAFRQNTKNLYEIEF